MFSLQIAKGYRALKKLAFFDVQTERLKKRVFGISQRQKQLLGIVKGTSLKRWFHLVLAYHACNVCWRLQPKLSIRPARSEVTSVIHNKHLLRTLDFLFTHLLSKFCTPVSVSNKRAHKIIVLLLCTKRQYKRHLRNCASCVRIDSGDNNLMRKSQDTTPWLPSAPCPPLETWDAATAACP